MRELSLGQGILCSIVVLSHSFPVAPQLCASTCRDSVNNLRSYAALNACCLKPLPPSATNLNVISHHSYRHHQSNTVIVFIVTKILTRIGAYHS